MSWKKERQDDIDDLWNERSAFGLAAICQACGGGSISTCPCAYKEFLDSIDSPETLDQMLKEDEQIRKGDKEYLEKMMSNIRK